MALKKKNVFQEFLQEDYIPTGDQQIVKYVSGKGNNLHEVESSTGSTFLVSMPKKYRQTVWLKKGDCIVIDMISEGKKVLGEVICLLTSKSVAELINRGEWMPKLDEEEYSSLIAKSGGGDGDLGKEERLKNALLAFYASSKVERSDSPTMPPSSSSEEEESEENEGSGEDAGDDGDIEEGASSSASEKGSDQQNSNLGQEEAGYKSRVQFLTSGIVTVTNVVNDVSSLQNTNGNEFQSLSFETDGEDSSSLESHHNVHRKANTIRIQVNYPPESNTSSSSSNQNEINHLTA